MTSKLAELDRSLASAQSREEALRMRRARFTEDRERAQREIVAIRTALLAEEHAYDDLVASRRESELHLVRVKEKITALEAGIAETRDAILALKPRFESAQRATLMPDAAADLEGADLAALETRALDVEREREALAEEVGRLRLAEVSASAEAQAIETRVATLAKLAEELEELVRAREEDRTRAEEQIRLSSEDIATARAAVAGLHQEKTAVEARIEETSAAYALSKESRDALEAEIKGMKDQREVKRANIERVNVELAGVETRVASLVEKAREKFNQEFGDYLADRTLFQPAEWEGIDRAELEDLRRRLEEFGPVNMLAMSEHDEKKERFDFLSKQKQDLDEGEALTQAIRRIKEARRLLGETSSRCQSEQTFTTLFDGGEADLFVDSETRSRPTSRSSPARAARSSTTSRASRAASARWWHSRSCSRSTWSSRARSACSTKSTRRWTTPTSPAS
jgi:chromosome segregation protein